MVLATNLTPHRTAATILVSQMPSSFEPYQLLHGPYTPQPLRRGDKATCLFRDCDVVITG
jgi:hypothetical protein